MEEVMVSNNYFPKSIQQLRLIISMAIAVLAISCNKADAPDMFKTTGEPTIELRSVGNLHTLDISNNVDVTIFYDSLSYIEVACGKNLLPKVETTFENGILKIRNKNKWNFVRNYEKSKIEVRVHSPALEKIIYEGGGEIKSGNTLTYPSLTLETQQGSSDVLLDLNCNHIDAILHTGVSNLYLSGNCQSAYFYSNGFSIIRAENLQCDNVHVNNQSTGDFYVYALSTLLVEVYTYSTTFYRGNPTLTIYREGTGQVRQLP